MNATDASWLIRQLADTAVRALVPAVLAALVLALFRVRQVSPRLAVWTGVLYAALAVPFLRLLLPAIPVRVPARVLAYARPVYRTGGAGGIALSRIVAPKSTQQRVPTAVWCTPAPTLTTPSATAVPAVAGLVNWRGRLASLTAPEIALGGYLLILIFLLVRLGAGLVLSLRIRREAQRINDPGALGWLRWHALAMGVDRIPALLESAAVTVPLTIGVWRPVILLPAGWRDWESAKLSAVIAHELSHVRRNDSQTKALALAYRSFFWFSPLSWWLESHLAALAEQASDLAAIGAGAEPGYYAEVLMSFFKAIQSKGARVCRQGVAMAARSGRAQDRIEKILSSRGTIPAKRTTRLTALLALPALPLVYLTAVTRPVLVANPLTGQPAAQFPAPPAPPSPAVPPLSPVAPLARVASSLPPVPAAPHAPLAPAAPLPPPAWAGQPEPPEPPEPPQGGDDGDWMINNAYEGMSFAVVSGKSVMMNGSDDDADTVRALRKKIGSDFIWFIHDGNSYVIRDAATVERAQQLYAPMDELGRQQDELGRQQDELGRKQDELGKQQDAVRVKVPADLEARLKKVEDEIRRLGPDASQDDLGRLQGELGDIQGYIGDLQGKAGDAQGELGRKQGELGAQQGELGRKQGELGRRQGEIARAAAKKMQGILEQALSSGKAQRAPQ